MTGAITTTTTANTAVDTMVMSMATTFVMVQQLLQQLLLDKFDGFYADVSGLLEAPMLKSLMLAANPFELS